MYLIKKNNRWIDASDYFLKRLMSSPFKNYKSALRYLRLEINRKIILSDYKPTNLDWALITLFKSKKFYKKNFIEK